MADACGSPYACRTKVAGRGSWCFDCQSSAASSAAVGDNIALARCPNLDGIFQGRLAFHPEPLVRIVLQERSDLLEDTRRTLARDVDPAVYTAAAASTATPQDELLRLHYRDEPDLLWVLAGNVALGAQGLANLTGHPNRDIAERARNTIMTIMANGAMPTGLDGSPFHRPVQPAQG
jgi:hypothetical protein